MRSRIENLQALRAFAVLLVLFLHWRNLERTHRTDALLPEWADVGHAGVDIFFVISGFIMVVIARNYRSDGATARSFLYHRWARIYPVYWFWFLVTLGFYFTVPGWLGLQAGQMPYLLESFFLLPTWSMQLVPVSWTLKYELYFYLVFSAVILLPARWRMLALLGWGGAMIAGQAVCYEAPDIQCNKNLLLTMHPLGLEFLFGALIAWFYLRRRNGRPLLLLACGIVFVLVGFVVYVWTGIHIDDNLWYRVLLFGLPAAVLLYGCVEIERQFGIKAPRWLVAVGTASYSLYLSHLLLMTLLYGRLAPYEQLPTLWLDLLIFALTIGIALSAYRWIELPLLRLFRRGEALRQKALQPGGA